MTSKCPIQIQHSVKQSPEKRKRVKSRNTLKTSYCYRKLENNGELVEYWSIPRLSPTHRATFSSPSLT